MTEQKAPSPGQTPKQIKLALWQAVSWMVLGCLGTAAMNVLARYISRDLPPLEIAFFRNAGQLLCLTPWMLWTGFAVLKTNHLRKHAARSVTGILAMSCWFTTLSLMPVTEAMALNFTSPLFVVLGAIIFFAEPVGWRRLTAVGIGFVGVLIILRPGVGTVSPAMGLALLSAAFMAASALIVKSLSGTDSAATTVTYMALFMTPISLIPALFVWQWPSLEALSLCLFMGLLGTISHFGFARAFQAADASLVIPFHFTRLPFAALLAYLAFGEVADFWTWAGAAVIFSAGAYIARREISLKAARDGVIRPPLVP